MSNIIFVDRKSVQDIAEHISSIPNITSTSSNITSSLSNPHIVEWFIGENGLKAPTLKIHQELASKITIPVTYWLYDLTSWAAFRDPKRNLTEIDPNVEIIASFNHPNIRSIASSEFFKWLYMHSEWVQDVLSDPSVYEVSSQYPDMGVSIAQLFSNDTTAIPNITTSLFTTHYSDTGKCYSAFQYIEGCYLISRLASEQTSLCFVLPNDEDKYYRIPRLANDLEYLQCKGSVYFFTFPYGSKLHHRPYSGNSKLIKAISRKDLAI